MYCAQFIVCLIDCFFAFQLYMYIILLALFFAMVSIIPSFISVVKLFTFAPFVVCRFFSMSLPRFAQFQQVTFRFFLRSGLVTSIFFGKTIRFIDLVHFCIVFLLGLVLTFFPFENQWVVQFALARFPFFWSPSFRFLLFSCLYICIMLRAPLVSSLFVPKILSSSP